jgi:hypothetical protein
LEKLVWLSCCGFGINSPTYNRVPHVIHTFMFLLFLEPLVHAARPRPKLAGAHTRSSEPAHARDDGAPACGDGARVAPGGARTGCSSRTDGARRNRVQRRARWCGQPVWRGGGGAGLDCAEGRGRTTAHSSCNGDSPLHLLPPPAIITTNSSPMVHLRSIRHIHGFPLDVPQLRRHSPAALPHRAERPSWRR